MKKGVGVFDHILYPRRVFVFGADHCNPTDGQTANRADGGVRVRGDHVGGKPGLHPHAGRRNPPVFRVSAHRGGAGIGVGTVLPVAEKPKAAAASVRKTGYPY